MEIKKREVIFSVVIVSILIIIGIFISDIINQSLFEKYQIYDSAVRIDSEDQFRYGMSTNIGPAFVYGQLVALDPVSYPDVSGQYSYISKRDERYTMHTRTVKHGKSTRVEVYYTWDTVRTESKSSTKISFLNVEFSYDQIPFPPTHHIDTVKTGSNTRSVYYGSDTTYYGTIFSSLSDNTIFDTRFYDNMSIEQVVDSLESGTEIVIFWVLWVILIILAVIGFYYLENNWLDDKISKEKNYFNK